MTHGSLSSSESAIKECQLIRETYQYCTFNTSLIFDLDNTILRPTHEEDLGSDQWFRQIMGRAFEKFPHPMHALQSTILLNKHIQELIKIKPVEPDTPAIVDAFLDMNMTTIAVTARGDDLVDITRKQLSDIHVHFTIKSDPPLRFELCGRSIIYVDHILFCNGVNKGLCVTELQKRLHVINGGIVMVDDVEKNLIDVLNAVQPLGIEFVGLRYNHLDQRVTGFDLKRANVKLASVSSFFSRSVVNIINDLELEGYTRELEAKLAP